MSDPRSESLDHAARLAQQSTSLEPDSESVRSFLDQVTERIVHQLESLSDQPASSIQEGPRVARDAREEWPPSREPLGDLLDLLFEELAPCSFNNPGPGFMAYIPGGGLFYSALADLISGSLNRYVTVWAAAPGFVQLETNVIRWFCSMVGFPESAGGFLSSGGSVANLSALVAARHDRLPENFLKGTLYLSDQTHHSMNKAALIAGLPTANVRQVPVDSDHRMSLDALEEQITRDRDLGLQPFMVVGNAGTTNTGAVDPLGKLSEIAARHRLWFHVDGAYGGFFCLTQRGRRRLAGIEHADSITLDPHKGLFLPYGTGSLLVRDTEKLRNAHTATADYMPPSQESAERLDFAELSPELSRSFRGLRVWLPLKLTGVEPFVDALDEKLDLADWLAERITEIKGLEVVAQPQLSTLAFRRVDPCLTGEQEDDSNERLLAAINARQRVFLTPTRLAGRFVIRVCVLNFRTHQDRMEMCLEDIREALFEIETG